MLSFFKKMMPSWNEEDEFQKKSVSKWKADLHEIIFESDTFEGKVFDIVLLFFIFLSTCIVMLESVQSVNVRIGLWLYLLDWWVTISFTVEYILRIISVKKPLKYITSIWGIIDLLAILPNYLSIFFIQTHYLSVIRVFRLLRIFRVFKLGNYVKESNLILISLRNSKRKIIVFLYFILITTLTLGSLMYVVESGEGSGFSSIPQSMYWAVVTLTTVGYGDIAPVTVLGKFIASFIMILGYSTLAVPTGLVSVEYRRYMDEVNKKKSTQVCPHCMAENHQVDAIYCRKCGHKLNEHD